MKLCHNTVFKNILYLLLIGALSTVIGFFLLLFVFLLPTGKICENARTGLLAFNVETEYFSSMPGYASSVYDNVTDAVYLTQAMIGIDEDGWIETALGGYSYYAPSDESQGVFSKLDDYFNPKYSNEISKQSTHVRFWNGYLILLKPLLLFFSYSDLRQINLIVQCFMFLLLFCEMQRGGLGKYIPAFLISYLFMNPIALSMNIFFSGFIYTAIIPCIILLHFRNITEKRWIYVFEITGICAAYFNMNSFQLISWGYPLIFLILILVTSNRLNSCKSLLKTGGISFGVWFLGYSGMIVAKWVLAYIFTDIDVINTINENITSRLSNYVTIGGGRVLSRVDAIGLNIGVVLGNKIWVFLEICFILVMIWQIRTSWSQGSMIAFRIGVSLSVIMIVVPFARYIILLNHSYIHRSFVYRIMAISVFAVNACLVLTAKYKSGD